jgi:hypothetical protein
MGEGGDERRPLCHPVTAAAVLVLSVLTHLHGLGSLHIMGNGDEMVYMQITRVTAAGGRWLPLASEMPGVVNTKPPLLFWQGIVSTDWGRRWSLLSLRWPSVGWTLLTAALVGLLARRMNGDDAVAGLFAAALFLSFLSTYRYGRPFLTNPPETFWAFLCCFTMIWWRPASFRSRLLFPTLLGAIAGIALLTKSFAQLLPIGTALAWWHLRDCRWQWRPFLLQSAPGLAWTAGLALGIFSLWFVFDPCPEAIWREFVVQENLGKLDGGQPSYLAAFLWGRTSVWALAFGWFTNAGLLAFPLAGTLIRGWQHRDEAGEDERLLWIWMAVIFLAFCIPTQRSGRYLLEAMPAVAVLMTLHWRRILPQAFRTTLVAAAAIVLLVVWLSLLLARQSGGGTFSWSHWPILLAAIAIPAVGLLNRRRLPACAVPATLATWLSISSFLTVFDAPRGVFSAATTAAAADRVVWAPENFLGAAELQRFLLPASRVRGYPAGDRQPAAGVAAPNDLVLVVRPLAGPAPAAAIGSRLELASRHTATQFFEMATGRLQENLFCREWLVPATALAHGQ